MTRPKANKEMIERSLGAYQPRTSAEEEHVRRAQDAGFDDTHFDVGDEVISTCGSMAGVIISIFGDEALISWSARGKSVEDVHTLTHTIHQDHA